MCTILCILVWVSLLENYSPTLNVSATASWSKGLKTFFGASKISNWLCYLQFMPQACLNAHQVLPLGNWRRSIMKVTNLWFTKPRGKHLLPVIWTATIYMGLTGGAALKKGGKSARICDSSASSCCYPANLITTPLCALVGCKETQRGGGVYYPSPFLFLFPPSHHASQSLGRQEEVEDEDRLMSCTRGETNTNESKLKRGTNRK